MRRSLIWCLVFLVSLGLAKPNPPPRQKITAPQILELAKTWKEIQIFGKVPISGLEPYVRSAKVQILTGSVQPSFTWATSLPGEIRVLKGRVSGEILFADGKYMLVKDDSGYVLLVGELLIQKVMQELRWSDVWKYATRIR